MIENHVAQRQSGTGSFGVGTLAVFRERPPRAGKHARRFQSRRSGENEEVKTFLATVIVAVVVALPAGSVPAARSACPYQGQVFIYGQNGWETLTNALA